MICGIIKVGKIKKTRDIKNKEENKMYGIRWQEFNKKDQLVMKEKYFETEKALNKFIEKLMQKDNFHSIYATCK